MRNNKSLRNVHIGMRVKVGFQPQWCGVKTMKKRVWLKGVVAMIDCPNAITLTVWSKRTGRIDNVMCVRDQKTMLFKHVVPQKNRHNKRIEPVLYFDPAKEGGDICTETIWKDGKIVAIKYLQHGNSQS